MGGSVFSNPPHNFDTPRMPPLIYQGAKDWCASRLRAKFPRIECPVEAPEKTDHGDVDLFAQGDDDYLARRQRDKPHECFGDVAGEIGDLLQADRVVVNKGPVFSAHFAVPWRAVVESQSHLREAVPSDDQLRRAYFQIDLTICDTSVQLEWFYFKYSNGDLWNILGCIIRPYGLTADDTGLWLRIPEIEAVDKKRAKILLTSSSADVLDLLAIPRQPCWTSGFRTVDDLFEYVAQTFLFCSTNTKGTDSKPTAQGTGNSTQGKLTANDRRRLKMRHHFRRWLEEYVPRCWEEQRSTDRGATRESVRQLAFERFGVEDEYTGRLDAFLREQNRLAVKNKLMRELFPSLATNNQHTQDKRPLSSNNKQIQDGGHLPPNTQQDGNPPEKPSQATQRAMALQSRLRKAMTAIILGEDGGADAQACEDAIPNVHEQRKAMVDARGCVDLDIARTWVGGVMDAARNAVAVRMALEGGLWGTRGREDGTNRRRGREEEAETRRIRARRHS